MLEKNHLFDVRLTERNLKLGLITKEELAKHLAGLQDLTGRFENSEVGVKEDEFAIKAVEVFIEEQEEEEEGEINE